MKKFHDLLKISQELIQEEMWKYLKSTALAVATKSALRLKPKRKSRTSNDTLRKVQKRRGLKAKGLQTEAGKAKNKKANWEVQKATRYDKRE